MAKNKKTEKPEEPSEQQVLEQRVDAMMDPKRPEAAALPDLSAEPAATSPSPAPVDTPAIDIFKDVKTAPSVSPDLLREIGIHDKPSVTPSKKPKIIPVVSDEQPSASSNVPQLVKFGPAAKITPGQPKDVKPETPDPVEKPEPPEAADKPIEPTIPKDAPEEPPTAEKNQEMLPPSDLVPTDTTDTSPKLPIDDPETDKAVDDIAVNEADEVLAAEDAVRADLSTVTPKRPKKTSKTLPLLKTKKFWLGLIALLIIVICALPSTRYSLLGLFLKKSITISVNDSKTKAPISNAKVSFHGQTTQTAANGTAHFKVKPGAGTVSVEKQYYSSYNHEQFVGLTGKNDAGVKLVATGRQVPILVLDKISGKPVANAEITVLKTTGKTDAKGRLSIVLPPNSQPDPATITAKGYTTTPVSVTVTDKTVPANTFKLTPSGKIYFLSNLSGKIDVVKANLDGTERQTVLAGTGREDNSTSLLASRDWRFLLFQSRRESAQPALYVIDTKTDKLTKIDAGSANYELVGWYGHDFVYDVVSTTMNRWQAGREILRAYDADRDESSQLDKNQAEGNGQSYAYQSFSNFYLVNGRVAYTTEWFVFDTNPHGRNLNGKNASIRTTSVTDSSKKDLQTFPASSIAYFQAALYEPRGVYYSAFNSDKNQATYYKLEDQKVSLASLESETFNKAYPTYLYSPNSSQTFWSEQRDGKNTLFTGDENADKRRQLATLSDFAAYGWYSDKYLLVSKGSSELYIMPSDIKTNALQPLKITDYYKPAQTFNGYGYGYGGL